MAVSGIFTSHSGLLGERQVDMSGRVLRLGIGAMAPALALTSGTPEEAATQTNFSWIEDEHITGNQATTAAATAVATTIVVDDAGIWTSRGVLMNERTGEHMLVSSIAADNKTITVVRGLSGTTAAAINIGDRIQSLGTAFEEGSGQPDAVSQQGEEFSNYVQIFKNGWAITGTAKAIKHLTGDKMAKNKQDCFNYHAEAIEYALIWGRKGSKTLNGSRHNLTNGIVAHIEGYGGLVQSANTGGVAGNLSMEDFEDYLRQLFDIRVTGMPNERIGYCGSKVLQVIQNMVRKDSTYNISVNETAYGIQVTTIKGFNGQLKLISHPMMVANDTWQQELYVVHPGLIKKRRLRPTIIQSFGANNNSNNGVDAESGFILDELGFEVKGARCMGILRNIKVAVAS